MNPFLEISLMLAAVSVILFYITNNIYNKAAIGLRFFIVGVALWLCCSSSIVFMLLYLT